MVKKLIRKGDTTTHGGKVLEGLDMFPVMGEPASHIGHMVYCPKCHGVYPIIEGVSGFSMFGEGVAVEGMKTLCGAELIASQDVLTIEVPDVLKLTQNEYSRYLVASLDGGGTALPPLYDPPKIEVEEKKYTRVTIMINDNNADYHGWIAGVHAGLMIGESGYYSSMIYDPSGSYEPSPKNGVSEQMGTGRILSGMKTDFEDYLNYHRQDDTEGELTEVFTFVFLVKTPDVEKIKQRIYSQENSNKSYQCATLVSTVLQGISPFESLGVIKFPRNLKKELIRIQSELWTKK